jgi:hypothetical protein
MITQVYQPELIPRRGEIVAWWLFVVLSVTWLALVILDQQVHWGIPWLALFFLVSGFSISLGNWLDRHTSMILDEGGIAYKNGLRKVYLKWDEVRQVRVNPAVWGKKVQVFGERIYFDFHTLGEVKYQGEVKGRTGFVQGETILKHILENSDLLVEKQQGKVVYYVRM